MCIVLKLDFGRSAYTGADGGRWKVSRQIRKLKQALSQCYLIEEPQLHAQERTC